MQSTPTWSFVSTFNKQDVQRLTRPAVGSSKTRRALRTLKGQKRPPPLVETFWLRQECGPHLCLHRLSFLDGFPPSLNCTRMCTYARGFVHTPRAHTCTFRSVWLARPSAPGRLIIGCLMYIYANGPYSLHPRFKNHYNCTLKLISMNEAQILCDKICL